LGDHIALANNGCWQCRNSSEFPEVLWPLRSDAVICPVQHKSVALPIPGPRRSGVAHGSTCDFCGVTRRCLRVWGGHSQSCSVPSGAITRVKGVPTVRYGISRTMNKPPFENSGVRAARRNLGCVEGVQHCEKSVVR